jgi:hypothetical protein
MPAILLKSRRPSQHPGGGRPQINLDRHAEVAYCLINVGAIQMAAIH